jgi:HSP20 family protein
MNMRDLIPWSRSHAPAPLSGNGLSGADPFMSLHREVNRLFDDAFRGFGFPAEGGGAPAWSSQWPSQWPSLEMSETDKDIRVSADVPGLEEKDVEVVLDNGVLTIRGEKKAEREDTARHFSERYYGRFERRMSVGADIEPDKVRATFKNGVLDVTLPKTEKARAQTKRIPINSW